MATVPFVLPEALPAILEDDVLVDVIQETVVGITGLLPTLVRPSAQPNPPLLPDFSVNWVALLINTSDADAFAFIRQVNETDIELERDQEINLLASFYGPNSQRVCGIFKDGLQIEQNRFALGREGIKLVNTARERHLPSLVKEVYQQRYDLPVLLRRRIRRVYKSASINSAGIGLDNEHYITPIIVSPPTP
jgi:hypothetical protein